MSSRTDDANLRLPVTRYPGNLGMEKSSPIGADNRYFRNIGFKGQEAFFRYRESGNLSWHAVLTQVQNRYRRTISPIDVTRLSGQRHMVTAWEGHDQKHRF